MTDEESNAMISTKSGGMDYDRVALTEQVDWVDDPSEEPPQEHDDDDDLFRDEPPHEETTSTRDDTPWYRATLLPDDRVSMCGTHLVDGPVVVKLLKFIAVTVGAIGAMYKLVRLVNWEHKAAFTLDKFWTYESSLVVNDAVVFFVVARLWKQRGVDHAAWIITMVASNVFMSYLPQFKFLAVSFTLYNMHCKWSWKLWVFILTLTPLVVTLVLAHVHYAVRRGFFVRKFLELVMAFGLWLLPAVSSPYFHLHHWFAGWWLGMHANYDTWWSRATLAWCWGMYINGIAAYGRDPVLTCGYALWVSQQNRCPFLDCYTDGLAALEHGVTNDTDVPVVQPMVKPDWRNCSDTDAYHP